MENSNREKILRFVNRDGWQHSWHMKRTNGGAVDCGHPDNVKMIREQIAEARQTAKRLIERANEVERIMDANEKQEA